VTRQDDPSWRKFEELVAGIEQTLAGSGAVVKSPDDVPDVFTGQLREVDASIRLSVGPTPILITVECRERKGNEDITWIEQLATKKANIGAAKTIAVSSTGFSAAAQEAAGRHGIELRTLEDRIGEEIVQQFLSGLKFTVIHTAYTARTIAFTLEDGRPLPGAEFGDDLRAALATDGISAVIATHVATGEGLTIGAILSRMDDHDVPPDGSPIAKQANLEFTPQTYTVSTTQGPRFLQRVKVVADFTRRDVPAPATSLYEYGTPEKPLRRVVEAVAEISDTEGVRLLVDIDSPTLERPAKDDRNPDKPAK